MRNLSTGKAGLIAMSEMTIRAMDQDEDFANWMKELLELEAAAQGLGTPSDDCYLVLSNEIGDWIGGLRYAMRGGVARLLDVTVTSAERHQGHGHRLLLAFEERVRNDGAHLAEFWTDDLRAEGLLAAFGWRRILSRPGYIGGDTWALMEKRFEADEP
ncbi:MAG: GNAT family N-acetyltransferase [Gemmatimonadales bacterium]|nr:GNAT family N-acetyltransferase [Gemmatimonadales bacterium]